MWNKLIALAVTLPMTITIAMAQASQDADIQAYSQDLAMRIARGRQSGQLSQANYNSLQAIYNQVEMIRRSMGKKPMNMMVRTNMMNSLTNLDKQLTTYLHDDINSRYQMWDPTRRSWRNNWWMADANGANSFNDEIDAYQNSLKQRIDSGRASGKITRAELAQLNTQYDNIDRVQQQYRLGGFSSWERNSLMSMLTQLDRDITTQMQDDENSHYRHWNPNGKSWSNNWWKNSGNTGANLPGMNRPGSFPPGAFPSGTNPPSNNDGRGGWGTRSDWNNQGNNNDSRWGRDAGRGGWEHDSGRGDWNRTSGSGNASSGNTGIVPPAVSNPPQTTPPQNVPPQNNPQSSTGTGSGGASNPNPSGAGGAGHGPSGTPTTGSGGASNAGSTGSGTSSQGSSASGEGRHGSWGGQSGDGRGNWGGQGRDGSGGNAGRGTNNP